MLATATAAAALAWWPDDAVRALALTPDQIIAALKRPENSTGNIADAVFLAGVSVSLGILTAAGVILGVAVMIWAFGFTQMRQLLRSALHRRRARPA